MIKSFYTLLFLTLCCSTLDAQTVMDYASPHSYTIAGIKLSGTDFLNKDILATLSGLSVGQEITVPGQDISNAINKLWRQKLFAAVEILADSINTTNNNIWLNIKVTERPRIGTFSFTGAKKGDIDDIRKKINIARGQVFNDNVKTDIVQQIKSFYLEKGYADTKVNIGEGKDSSQANSLKLTIVIDKGKRQKIDEIHFIGNDHIAAAKLKHKMKDTKANPWYSIFSVSKFNKSKYEDDKQKLAGYYNDKGFRDAVIVSDSVFRNPLNPANVIINIKINEGARYYFRNITWTGNSKYTSAFLSQALGIQKGDVYSESRMHKRLTDDPLSSVSSLYMDFGYLFFQCTPVEVRISNDSVDIEMHIYEGPQAVIDKIIITGNTKTNENVIRRAIRTYPGDKFSRSDIIRTQRELQSLGYFNAEKIEINPIPHVESGTVDIAYKVEEKPSDQLELSAGWGGTGYTGGIFGTAGIKFSNFSIRNIPHFSTWNPLPSGDGQALSLRAQSNGRYYQSYNGSFTEPWLGGKKPNSFSVSLFRTVTNAGPTTNPEANHFGLNGVTVGLGKQLKIPDDLFSILFETTYQKYQLRNWTSGGFGFTDGNVNDLALKIILQRNSLGNPTFPESGSSINLSVAITPPWSAFGNRDFGDLPPEQKYKWLEYHKWRFNTEWYTPIAGKFVLKAAMKTGFLGYLNKSIGTPPFNRFQLGGDGLSTFSYNITGKEIISQRGYDIYTNTTGATIFNKYTAEIRYPFTTNPQAFVYGLIFAEGGNAWYNFSTYNPFDLNRSFGVGLRVFLPMFGIIGFDYGLGIDKTPASTSGSIFSKYGKFNIVLGFEPQ